MRTGQTLCYKTGQIMCSLHYGLSHGIGQAIMSSAGVQYQPGEGGLDPSLSLRSTRGAVFGGAEALWDAPDTGGLAGGMSRHAMAVQSAILEIGYGLESFDNGGRVLKFGLKLNAGEGFDIGFELGRRETGDVPQDAVQLRGTFRF